MPQDISPQVQETPFDFVTLLSGRTRAVGIFEDRFGRLRRKLHVDLNGRWIDGEFVIDEHFTYGDGATEDRVWRVTPTDAEGGFTAHCDGCIGRAAGYATGDTIQMRYRFRLAVKSAVVDVTFDDRIYKMDDAIAINRAAVTKWGIRIGDVTLIFLRDAALGRQLAA